MAVSAHWYANALLKALNKEINWLSDDIRVMLYTSSYTPNQNTDIYKDVVNPAEASGTGYTAGGVALASKTATESSLIITLSAANVSWSASTITATGAIIYDNTPASNKPLLGWVDFGGAQSSNNGNFSINWNASGIFTITAS